MLGPTAHLPAMWYLSLVRDGQLFAPYDLAVSTACLCPPQGSQGGQRSAQHNVQREKSLPECFPALSFHRPSHTHTHIMLATYCLFLHTIWGFSQGYVKFSNPSELSSGGHPVSHVSSSSFLGDIGNYCHNPRA